MECVAFAEALEVFSLMFGVVGIFFMIALIVKWSN